MRRRQVDSLLDVLEKQERDQRVAWARTVEGPTPKERAALVRVFHNGTEKADTDDIRVALEGLDRVQGA